MEVRSPKVRTDLKYQADSSEEGRFFVKDPIRGEFYRYNELQVAMMQAMDGVRTIPEIQAYLFEQYEAEVAESAILRFVDRLEKAFLLHITAYRLNDAKTRRVIRAFLRKRGLALRVRARDGSSPEAQLFEAGTRQLLEGDPCLAAGYLEAVLETNPANARAQQILECIHEAYFTAKIVIPSHVKMWFLWNPDRFLGAIDAKIGRFLFSGVGIALVFLFIGSSVFSAIDVLERPHLFAKLGLIDIPLVLLVFALHAAFHELSHALACKHYGGVVDDLGLLLMYGVIPGAYCDVSESYLFEKRSHKIAVQLAGVSGHMVLQGLAWHIMYLTDPAFPLWGPLLALNLYMMYSNFKNLIPLAKFDGYYALAEWLDIPNLRERSFAYVRSVLGTKILGLPDATGHLTPRERSIFLAYGSLACVFTALMMYFLFISFLLPKAVDALGTVGLVLAIGYIAQQVIMKVGVAVFGVARLAIRQRAMIFTRRRTIAFSVGFVALVMLFSLPWPLHVQGDMLLEPTRRAPIRAQEAGSIESVRVHEGDRVEKGQLLATLRADELVRDRAIAAQDLVAGRAQLDILRRGARDEERAVADATMRAQQTEDRAANGRMADMQRFHALGGATTSQVLASAASANAADGMLNAGVQDHAMVQAGSRIEDVAAAEANVHRLEAALAALDVRVGYLEIRSPVAGIIVTERTEELLGRWVARGADLLEVHDVSSWRIKITPDHGETLGALAVGQRVEVRAKGEPNTELTARLETIVSPETNDASMQLYASGAHPTWRSGMTGTAQIFVPSHTIAYRIVALPLVRIFDYDLWRVR